MKWQLFETAPTDGREVIAAFYDSDNERWIIDIVEAHATEITGQTWGVSRNIAPHTYWMPLPEPPK